METTSAAGLGGVTLTGHLVATAGEDFRNTVENADGLMPPAEDQPRFAKVLIYPRAPNAGFARARSVMLS